MKYKVENSGQKYHVVEVETEAVIQSYDDSKNAKKMASQLGHRAFEGFTPFFFVMHSVGVFK